jgi:hypothetical protein
MDWSKGKRTVTFNYKIRRVIATGSQQGVLPSAWERVGTVMSDAAGQQGSRLEVAPVLTVGHALFTCAWAMSHRNALYICAQRGSQVSYAAVVRLPVFRQRRPACQVLAAECW